MITTQTKTKVPAAGSTYRDKQGEEFQILGVMPTWSPEHLGSYSAGEEIKCPLVRIVITSDIKKGDTYVRYRRPGQEHIEYEYIEYWRSLADFNSSILKEGRMVPKFQLVENKDDPRSNS